MKKTLSVAAAAMLLCACSQAETTENGLFEPLETYLTDEKYADIYALMPQKYWNSYQKDINNIITYGAEGVQHDVADGKAVMRADEDGDVEQYIADFNASLYAAGLQDVLDEVDRQLEVYDEANN